MRNKQVFVTAVPPAPSNISLSETRHHQPPPDTRRPGILTRKRSLNKVGISSGTTLLPPPKRNVQMIPSLPKRVQCNSVNTRLKQTVLPSAPNTSSDEVSREYSQISNSSPITCTIASCDDIESLPNAGQTVYMTTQTAVDEMSRTTDDPSSTAVLIPVVFLGSGDNKFEEAQKTVVVHVEQMGDDVSSGEAIVELRDVDGPSTHRNTRDDGPGASEEELEAQHSVIPVGTGQTFLDDERNKKSSAGDSTPAKQTSGTSVRRWYDDVLFACQLQCLLCNQSMEALQLAEHLPSVHGYKLPEVGRAAFLKYIRSKKIPIAMMPGRAKMSGREGVGACPYCTRVFLRRLDLLGHMHDEHGQEFVLFDFEFESQDQFDKWLELITVEFMTGYSRYRTNVNASGIKTQMYLCRLESKPVCKATTYKTDRRARNKTKTTYCTAHLRVRFLEDGRLHVKGSPTHLNHPVDLFNAYRSLDDVPFDALPGYGSITPKAANTIHTRTVEFCQRILKRIQSLNDFVHASPAPSDYNITRHLHTKLQTLSDLLSGYKFRSITIHEEIIPSETVAVQ